MKNYFKKIDIQYLKSIHNGNINTPTMYFHPNVAVQNVFWDRLNVITKFIIENKKMSRKKCLDFGGGSGVFLPTLCGLFDEVINPLIANSQSKAIEEAGL